MFARFVLPILICALHAAAQSLSVAPQEQRIALGAEASIRLCVGSVSSLRAYSVTVQYDPAVVRYRGTTELNLFSSSYQTFFFSHVDSAKGTVTIDCAILGEGSVTGSGMIAEVRFAGAGIGVTSVKVTGSDLRAAGNTSIPVAASDGTIGVDRTMSAAEHVGPVSDFCLVANYPNPFNPSTSIVVTIPHDEVATVSVCTVGGRTLDVLMDGFVRKGTYRFRWNGSACASGIYAAVVRTAGRTTAAKMMLLK